MATRKSRRAPASKLAAPPLAGLSSDWYWEQDAELRFTRVEVPEGTPAEQRLARDSLGKRRWETGIQIDGGWDGHRELLEARAPFREVLMWRELEDGSRRYVSVSGEPVHDAHGRFVGYRGVGRNVTVQKRGEELARLQHLVTRRLAEAASAAEGVEALLRAICENEGWDCAELWRLEDPAGVMRLFADWAAPGQDAARRFVEASRGLEYTPEDGLIGAAWRAGQPLWIPDTTRDPRARRKLISARTGHSAALLCPVRSEGRVAGMLTFACTRMRPPEDALTQALMAMATQLGLFLRRADAEARLRQSEERYRRTFELAGVGVAHVGLDRLIQRVNPRLCQILGYTEAELIGRTGRELSHPEDRDVMNAQRSRLYSGELDAVRGEKRYLRKDGSTVWVAFALAVERDAGGKPLYEIVVYDDISARKAMEQALRENEVRFRSLTQLSSDWFWEQDTQYRFTRIEGPRVAGGDLALQDRLIGLRRWESGLEVEGGWEAHRALLDARKPFHDVLMWRRMASGDLRYVCVSGEPVYAADGGFAGYRGVGRDTTEVVLARERIASLAYHDALTGLDNRISLAPALEKAVDRARRRPSRLAGLFVDLDGFKQVNDAHGHDAGDRLLIEVARRLRATLRSSDPVARLGGDEFFVVIEDIGEATPVERVAEKLLAALDLPYDIGIGRQLRVSASIGISVYPDDAGDADTLVKHADTAMYSAKQAGKNTYRFFKDAGAANDARTEEQAGKR